MESTVGEMNQPPIYRVKGAGYMGSLNSVSQGAFTGTYSWFNDRARLSEVRGVLLVDADALTI